MKTLNYSVTLSGGLNLAGSTGAKLEVEFWELFLTPNKNMLASYDNICIKLKFLTLYWLYFGIIIIYKQILWNRLVINR